MRFFYFSASVWCAVFFSGCAFSAVLPDVIDTSVASNFNKVGTVSVSSFRGSPDDAIAELQRKASGMGANKIRIVSLGNPGDSDLWYGSADIYSNNTGINGQNQ